MQIFPFACPKHPAIYLYKNVDNHDVLTVLNVQMNEKKSARSAGTFSLRASRAARIARKFERAWGARFDRRASRSIFCMHFCNFLINYMIIDKFIFFQISQKGKTIVGFI